MRDLSFDPFGEGGCMVAGTLLKILHADAGLADVGRRLPQWSFDPFGIGGCMPMELLLEVLRADASVVRQTD